MSNILVSVFSTKTSVEQLHDRLRELSDQRQKQCIGEFIASQIDNRDVKECVVGPNHIAFLLDDQRVCRLKFTVNQEKFDQTSKDDGDNENSSGPSRSVANVLVHSASRSSRSDLPFTISGEALSTLSGQLGRWGSPRTVASTGTANRPSTTVAGSTAPSSGGIRVRGRIVRAAMRGRAGNNWLSTRPVIPASAVPEELVAQAQVVLQGKSRNTIIRELQRTNLDVNLAVNNLLSRDDDETDDHDDSSEAYIPGDDLISIINGEDSSFVVDPDAIFSSDFLYGSSVNRPVSRTGRRTASNEGNNRESDRESDISGTVRQCEKYYLDLLNIDQSGNKSVASNKNQKIKSSLAGEPIRINGDLEFWTADEEDTNSSLRFNRIASLHSELIAVSVDGKLHQWKWSDARPSKSVQGQHSHSRAVDMKLKDEKIVALDACIIRASVMTESGKIATWLDETLSDVACKLEHPAQVFAEFRNQTVTTLHVCDLYSCVQLSNGSLFWWGVFPFEQRRKLMDKVKQKAKKSAISGSSLIQAGTQVCLRSCPLYYPGAIGFTTLNGQPKVGELLEQAWTITEKCRFKILTNGKKEKDGTFTDDREKSEYGEPSELSKKRKRSGDSEITNEDTTHGNNEEHWNLRDVIFVEDVRNVPLGRVLKVDGAYALVNFSDNPPIIGNPSSEAPSDDLSSVLKSCRLVRKDELQIVRWTSPPKMSECFQKVPKQLSVPGVCKVLSMALDMNGVHTLLMSPTSVRYAVFSLASGRVEPGGTIPPEAAAALTSPSSGSPILYTGGMDSLVILRDGNGSIFPLVRDCIGGIKDPTWVNLCPMSCLSMGHQTFESGSTTTHAVLALMVVRSQSLLKNIGNCDIEKIKENLQSLERNPDLAEKVMNEKCDGNRNLIHKAVSCCFPSSATNKQSVAAKPNDKDAIAQANLAKSLDLTQRATPRDMDDDIFPIDLPIPTTSWPPERIPLENQTAEDNDDPPSKWVPVGEKSDCLTCLTTIIKHPVIDKNIINLLKEKDANGCTPFMSAVRGRAYSAALLLFETAKNHATKEDKIDQDLFISMIYPQGDSNLSPFHMICCNDTCSFTWTGTTHINQDIFECRTCGLVGTLCCCTECARVCHIGHDCKLKRTSPTAYCDCWEKCACKALIPGEQKARLELLKRLIADTDLATKPNKDGEHILLFLAKTVARQGTEQGQYVSNKSSDSKSRSANARSIGTPALPAHDLEPPRFAKLALEHTLKDWRALRSMLMFGSNVDQVKSRSQPPVDDSFANMIGSSILSPDEQARYLKSQEGTARLDSFVRCLLGKCKSEYLKTLLKTLDTVIADAKEKGDTDPLMVARRFVRSVCRLFVVLSSSLGPNNSKKKSSPSLLPLMKCKGVFVSLNVIAVKELACIADALFAPVRLGVVYPSAPFTLLSLVSDGSQACEDLFSVLPLPSRTGAESTRGHHVRFENTQSERDEEQSQGNRTEEIEMDILTQEEQSSPGLTLESQEQPISNDGEEIQNAESDMEIDLLAESESDSDDSNADDVDDTQRSSTSNVATNRQGHSRSDLDGNRRSHDNETVDYYSGEESNAEVDDDEDGEIEDETDDLYETSIEPIVHRLISGSNRTPHALQWAVRNAHRSEGGAEASSHGYVGTANIRRGGSGASASADITNSGSQLYSMPSALARTFGIVVRELADILSLSGDGLVSHCIPLKQADLTNARRESDSILDDTWQWLWRVMETTETQLRFGASLTAVSDPAHPHHPLHEVQMKKGERRRETSSLLSVARNWNPDPKRKRRSGNGNEASDSSLRHDFLTYLLSLMRGSDNEHGDSLPKLEVTSLQHVAYILDAFVYYLRSKTKCNAEEAKQDGLMFTSLLANDGEARKCVPSKHVAEDSEDDSESDEDIPDDKDTKGSLTRFFKRSDSTLVLGYEPSNPFSVPMREALPLANRPHLLNPTARRDQLFGSNRSSSDELEADIPQCIGYGIQRAASNDTTPSTSFNSRLVPEISKISANCILGRWRMCLELFGRLFLDDVGVEPHSVLNEIGRFDVKEAKFRRDMEKLRNNHQKDLYIEEVERDRVQLIKQTFRKLDSFFGRRGHSSIPVSIHRLRVSFKDEPGEGSGVVRSFYTAIGEALLSEDVLPPLDTIFSGTTKDENHAGLVLLAGLTHRLKSRVRERERRRSAGTPNSSGMMMTARMRREREHAKLVMEREGRQKLNPDAKPYEYDPDIPDVSDNDEGDDSDPIKRAYLGRRLYSKVYSQQPGLASQITGMLLELSPTQIIWLLTQEEILKSRIAQAVDLLNAKEKADPTSTKNSQDLFTDKSNEIDEDDYDDYLDNSPLFFQPGKTGFYSPRCGKISVERLNCYRNVGRLIGLCLLQNELSPISFNRHVIKYILGREISWHDLAFFDPNLYEVLRLLIQDSSRPDAKELFSGLDLTFCIELSQKEGGLSKELVPNGKQKAVTPENIQDYVKRYADYRMITVAKKPLESLRRGVLDVLPTHTLEGLTAEDFRLLLNGSGNINVQQLMSYTSFSDETGGDSQDKLSKFKRWFWSIVESMTLKQKQEMLYFWTSSPAMPASSEGFQPMPSVTVKPSNDHQLPTANTCISRLYIPLYSSKSILKSKLLLAIKTRTFGFV